MENLNEDLLTTVKHMLQLSEDFDLDNVVNLYTTDFQMLMIQSNGTILQYGLAQHLKFLRDMRTAGIPPISTPIEYLSSQIQYDIGYVIAKRRLGENDGEQDVIFNFMLRRNEQGQWQIFREHNVLSRKMDS